MTKKDKIRVIVVSGPTASGKSALAVELAQAFDGEIVCADSRQIYREFDIACAKPKEHEKKGIAHHLFDVVNPDEEFNVADYQKAAHKIIYEIAQRDKTPILAGGTGFYLRTLLGDFDIPNVPPDKNLRKHLENEAKLYGNEHLHKLLEEIDPDYAKELHFNNVTKIIRAIEVSKALNMPMSKAKKTKEPPFDTLWIGLGANNREFLYEKINKRVDSMLEKGLVNEAKMLFEKYPDLELLRNTIGYQEFEPYFKSLTSLDEAVEKIKQNTRRYAKRQLTWFRANPQINWLEIENNKELFKQAKELCIKHGFEAV